jgi:hypothetical protein
MADFVVRLEGLNLSTEAKAAISREIQSVALRELAKVDTGGDFSARIIRGELQGIYVRKPVNTVFNFPAFKIDIKA